MPSVFEPSLCITPDSIRSVEDGRVRMARSREDAIERRANVPCTTSTLFLINPRICTSSRDGRRSSFGFSSSRTAPRWRLSKGFLVARVGISSGVFGSIIFDSIARDFGVSSFILNETEDIWTALTRFLTSLPRIHAHSHASRCTSSTGTLPRH